MKGSRAHNAHKAESLMNIARSAQAGGDMQTAANVYEQVIQLQPENPAPKIELARMLGQLDQNERAVTLLRDAAKQADNAEMKREIALGLMKGKAHEDAAALFKELVENNSGGEPSLTYNAWGITLDMLGRSKEAQEVYISGLKRYPGQSALTGNYGLSLALAEDYDEAIRILSPLANGPNATPTLRQNLALAYGLKGDMDKAREIAKADLNQEQVEENLRFYKRFIESRQVVDGAPLKLSKAVMRGRGEMHGPMMPMVTAVPTIKVLSKKSAPPVTPRMYGPFLPGQMLQ